MKYVFPVGPEVVGRQNKTFSDLLFSTYLPLKSFELFRYSRTLKISELVRDKIRLEKIIFRISLFRHLAPLCGIKHSKADFFNPLIVFADF